MANPRKFSEKIALHNQKQAEETAEFEKIMKEVSDATSKPLINNDDLKPHMGGHRERARSAVGPGPIRARPGDKRTDTSPYSSSYLSPPPDTGWRRTHSDSSLHTSSQEQVTAQRRGTIDSEVPFADPLRRNISATQVGKANFEMSRISGISPISSPPDPTHIPMGKNTGSLPDLTSCHFPPPLDNPIDQEDRGGSPYQTGINQGNGFPSSYQQTRLTNKFTFVGSPPHEAPGPPQTPPHYINQALHHQFVFQHPVSPLQPTSPQPVPAQQNCFNSYRTPVSRPSPQPSPSLSVRFGVGSPRSGSPQSPSSPGSVSSGMSPFPDHTNYILQTNALQHHFENISMADDSCSQLQQDPNNYFSTSPSHQVHFSSRVNTLNAQTAPNTPSSIPDIVLTDFSNSEELAKDLGEAIGVSTLDSEFFPSDDCLREGLDPIDLDGLQMLTDGDLITDPATEDHFRLDRL